MRRYLLLLCLFAIAPGIRAEVEWTTRIESPERSLLATVSCVWNGASIPLRLENVDTAEAVEFSLSPRKGAVLAKGSFVPQAFSATPFKAPDGEWANVAWQRLPDGWAIFVDNRQAARFREAWDGTVRLSTPADIVPGDDSEAPADYQQRIGSFLFEDAFMVPEGTADPLRNWEILQGDWRMHTVTGTVSGTNAKAKLGRQPTAAHSPNFYSLDGRGSNAVIVAGEAFYDRYRMKAALHHESGGTNGVVFLVGADLDAYGFTCRDNPEDGRLAFDLWRGRIDDLDATRETLRSVATDLLPGQWYALEAKIYPGRIICSVDGVAVFTYEGALPPGGQFGLFQNGEDGARFDDVSAGTHGDTLYAAEADIAYATLSDTARTSVKGGKPGKAAIPDDVPFETSHHLLLNGGKEVEGLLMLGSTADAARRFETVFVPDSDCNEFGLVAGWTGTNAPAWRLAVSRLKDGVIARLFHGDEIADEQLLPASDSRSFHLVIDATDAGEITGRVNGELAVIAATDQSVEGACGLIVGQGGEARALMPLSRVSAPIYRDRFEKNMSYVNDPFMKNWASPEGQWLQTPDGNAWFRSDFLGRIDVRLPFADPMELHVAVPEPPPTEGDEFSPPATTQQIVAPTPEALDGACRIVVADGIARLVATNFGGSVVAEAEFPVSAIPVTHFDAVETLPAADYAIADVHLDGHIFWVSCPTGILARLHLPERPEGRRMRVKGLALEHLRRTRIIRDHVVDCLFNESLAGWTINGGKWEVVNRFQCEPSWSHMNGESADTLAALWSKMEVGGDFSMEFYAGERHGWYDRVGDFNLTVLSRRGGAGDGYSVICTGWDPDSSQLRTRLLRNGETKAVTDRYLAPRFRDGNTRRIVEPLVAAGRDVHGAWYAMRLRRLGSRLEYIFDNVPVFAWSDPDPLSSGIFGIWTYRNSMMVARARITADEIRPRRFAIREFPVGDAAAKSRPRKAPATVPAGITNVCASTWPVEMLDPSLWIADDPVSRPILSFTPDKDGRPVMRVESSLGAGEFSARSTIPMKQIHTILGWSFEIARHPEARPEVGFAICEPTGKSITTNALYSFPLGGLFETRGPRRLAGSANVPPTPDGAKSLVWTPVTVWIPAEKAITNTRVLFEGFGSFQPSEAQEGIGAAPPGAWYAIRNLHPVINGAPLLTGPDELRPTFDALEKKALAMPAGSMQALDLPKEVDPRNARLCWGVTPRTTFGLQAELLTDPSDSFLIHSTLPWPQRTLDAQEVQVNGQAVAATFVDNGNSVLAYIPRPAQTDADMTLSVKQRDGRTFKQIFRPRQFTALSAATNVPPVLLSMRVERGFYQGFETRSPALVASHKRSQPLRILQDSDFPFGSYLRIANNGAPGRLQASLAPGLIDLGSTPLFMMKYRRGGPLPIVSLQAVGYGFANFTEAHPNARPVRFATPPPPLDPMTLDNPAEPREQWQTWFGAMSDAIGARQFRNGYAIQPADLVIGSFNGHDQTGRYSFLDVDELVGGPVVGPDLPLSITPSFSDADGVSNILCAVVEGPEPWASRTNAVARADGVPGFAPWIAITNDAPYKPFLGHLQDGVHHLVLTACDGRGAWSPVTDVPFMLDRRALTVESSVVATPNQNNGTALYVTFHTFGGSLPRFDTMKVICNGREIDLSRNNGMVSFTPDSVIFNLNWPSIFRREIRASKDGDMLQVAFTNIADAAGNTPASHVARIPIDYASDKTPPTVQQPRTGTNFFWYLPEIRQPREFIGGAPRNVRPQPVVTNGMHVLELRAVKGAKDAAAPRTFVQNQWQPGTHQYLAISARVLSLPKEPGVPPMTLQFTPQHLPEEAKRPPDNAPFSLPLASAENSDPQWVVAGANTGWKPGEWRDLVIDADAFLRNETGLDESPPIREFAIAMPGDDSYAIQVRAMAILMAWKPDHLITFNAYDASGIEGLVWDGGSAPELSLRPARVKLPANTGWLEVQVKDRAGNLTPPRFLPIPPASYTESDNLSVSEPAAGEEQ